MAMAGRSKARERRSEGDAPRSDGRDVGPIFHGSYLCYSASAPMSFVEPSACCFSVFCCGRFVELF